MAPAHVPARFSLISRLLHWLMAVLILAMLFIGVGMANTEQPTFGALVSIHKPLGIAILALVAIRLIYRLLSHPPPLPADMPLPMRLAAKATHILLYVLMFAVPLVGWAMVSAGRYPTVDFGAFQLPPILPQNEALYAALRQSHTVLAFLLFATFLAHLGAALFHGLIRRDGVLETMASARPGTGEA
jgi:cytochrome b561